MKVRFKTIEHERVEDAPFVGALISAIDCRFNCPDCFNQFVKKMPTQKREAQEIIDKVKSNIFNKGIILAGLEWTLQQDEARELIVLALSENLKVILYTGIDSLTAFKALYPKLCIPDIYIKYGKYSNALATINHIEYGVTLSSSNQHIERIPK